MIYCLQWQRRKEYRCGMHREQMVGGNLTGSIREHGSGAAFPNHEERPRKRSEVHDMHEKRWYREAFALWRKLFFFFS